MQVDRTGLARTELDAAFTALADPTRRAVIELLSRGPRRAGQLSGTLDTTAPAMSRHLRILRESGLIELGLDDTDARAKIYRLKRERYTSLRRWLDDIERFWTKPSACSTRRSARRDR